jgi:hypothetical protein
MIRKNSTKSLGCIDVCSIAAIVRSQSAVLGFDKVCHKLFYYHCKARQKLYSVRRRNKKNNNDTTYFWSYLIFKAIIRSDFFCQNVRNFKTIQELL